MTRPPLAVAAVQPQCVAYDVTANALFHAEAVRAAHSRVVVFPELSLTGYELDAPPVSLSSLEPVMAACALSNSVALVGAPVEGPHIAMLLVTGDGVSVAYRKMWLGSDEPFLAGPSPAVIEVDGWRLGLAICKDTGVVQHAADTAALGMDVYVAGTVKHSHESALQHARARRVAIDHGVFVVVSSFAGPTGGGFAVTAGESAIWSPAGEVLAAAGPSIGETVRATLV